MSESILLQGYYGRGNWGDDLLMCVSFRLLRSVFPSARIDILTADRPNPYICKLLGEDVALLKHGDRGHYDLRVHGGGGVFFDFARQPISQRFIEAGITAMGYGNYVRTETLLRQLAGKPRLSAARSVALGVGVGSFSFGSPAFRSALHSMKHMQAMWLRDEQSLGNLARFGNLCPTRVAIGSDMVFMHEHWLKQAALLRTKQAQGKPKIGIILRHWPQNNKETIARLREQLTALRETYELSVFCLEAEHDAPLIEALQDWAPMVWNPQEMSVEDFSGALVQQDAMLSSRAHGAICAACLNIPCVILEIEPKLHRIHEMLSHSSLLIAAHEDWAPAIAGALAMPAQAITLDVERNRDLSHTAFTRVMQWMQP